jgi:hypothetical protein
MRQDLTATNLLGSTLRGLGCKLNLARGALGLREDAFFNTGGNSVLELVGGGAGDLDAIFQMNELDDCLACATMPEKIEDK